MNYQREKQKNQDENKKMPGKKIGSFPNKRQIGAIYEEKVQVFLEKQGYHILEKNFYCRQGEIDLIAKKDEFLVFVEVKYRKNERFGAPEAAVTGRKQHRILAAARYYLYKNGYPADTPCRFDVVGVLAGEIRLTEDAFRPS